MIAMPTVVFDVCVRFAGDAVIFSRKKISKLGGNKNAVREYKIPDDLEAAVSR